MSEQNESKDTTTLKRMWSTSAAKIVERLRNGGVIEISEVDKLASTLERIEARQMREETLADYDRLREMTREGT